MQTPLAKGVLAGGVLGASLVALCLKATSTEGSNNKASDEQEGVHAELTRYKHLASDAFLTSSLQEPLVMFRHTDARACEELLSSLDELVGLYALSKTGAGTPALVAKALRARRAAGERLTNLMKALRDQKPLAASDLEQDVELIKKSLQDYVYNIDHEPALQRRMSY
jgi:hypothetical protein